MFWNRLFPLYFLYFSTPVRVNLPSQQNLPAQIKPSINIGANGGKFDVSVSLRNIEDKPLENIVLTLSLHKFTTTLSAHCNVGQYIFDHVRKVFRWDIGKIATGAGTSHIWLIWICYIK